MQEAKIGFRRMVPWEESRERIYLHLPELGGYVKSEDCLELPMC